LIDEASHAFDAVGQGQVERSAKFRVPPFVGKQLLVGRKRHHRVAHFMGKAIGHRSDQAQIGSFNFQTVQLAALGEIFDHDEGRGRQAGRQPLEGHDVDVKDRSRWLLRLILEVNRRTGLQHLISFGPQRLGQIAKFHFAAATFGAAEVFSRRFIRMQNVQVPAYDYAAATQLPQDAGHQGMVGSQLLVQPDVFERHPQLFEQVKNQL